jgi:hypothetical protein
LVLRNPLDNEIARTTGSAMSQLFHSGDSPPPEAKSGWIGPAKPIAIRRAPAPVLPPPTLRIVEVINGIKRTETQFDGRGEAKQ